MRDISFAIEAYDHNNIMTDKMRDIVSYDKACQIASMLKNLEVITHM